MIVFIFYILGFFVALVFLLAFIQGYIALFKKKPIISAVTLLVSASFWLIPNFVLAGILFFAFNSFVTAYAKMIDKKVNPI
ncbi:hypothetical protein PG614_10175 [Riemerella anatipestifer]|nr:hypothetical protein [Riemerella anatipestifer]MDY3534254.1 hypothetical protein [Riemerella anatipestifer]MDY3536312.1 hypothetical protein [Riemerella anatipestifer]